MGGRAAVAAAQRPTRRFNQHLLQLPHFLCALAVLRLQPVHLRGRRAGTSAQPLQQVGALGIKSGCSRRGGGGEAVCVPELGCAVYFMCARSPTRRCRCATSSSPSAAIAPS